MGSTNKLQLKDLRSGSMGFEREGEQRTPPKKLPFETFETHRQQNHAGMRDYYEYVFIMRNLLNIMSDTKTACQIQYD